MTDFQMILNRLERIERQLRETRKPKTWISGREVARLTGFNVNRLRAARTRSEIEWKEIRKGCYRYNLDTINPHYIKN